MTTWGPHQSPIYSIAITRSAGGVYSITDAPGWTEGQTVGGAVYSTGGAALAAATDLPGGSTTEVTLPGGATVFALSPGAAVFTDPAHDTAWNRVGPRPATRPRPRAGPRAGRHPPRGIHRSTMTFGERVNLTGRSEDRRSRNGRRVTVSLPSHPPARIPDPERLGRHFPARERHSLARWEQPRAAGHSRPQPRPSRRSAR